MQRWLDRAGRAGIRIGANAVPQRIEDLRPVRRGHDDDAIIPFETIHLNEELVKGLLTLIVTSAHPGTSVATDGIDLIDEDDTGSVLLPLLKEVANAARTDTHEHFHEIRPRD